MKNIIITLSAIILLSSCSMIKNHWYRKLNDGTWLTKKENQAHNDSILARTLRSFTKEEIKLLTEVPLTFTFHKIGEKENEEVLDDSVRVFVYNIVLVDSLKSEILVRDTTKDYYRRVKKGSPKEIHQIGHWDYYQNKYNWTQDEDQ